MKDYIFFDLDGTLTDSKEGIFNGLRRIFDHFGVHKTEQEMLPFLGPALWESLPKYVGLTMAQCEEAVKIYREYYNSTGIFENRPYKGIPELLARLKADGKKLVLATGKPEDQANTVLNHFGLSEFFYKVCGSTYDTSRSSKAQVVHYALEKCGISEEDKPRVIMVGDRENDICGAHENGLEVCAVLYGYGSQEEFEQHGADYICESVEDLGELLMHKSL